MNLPYLNTLANYPIKNSPEGFEAKALLQAWVKQLNMLLTTPGTNLAEINACIMRLGEIAHQATVHSDPELPVNTDINS